MKPQFLKVYIASPYTIGDVAQNVRKSFHAACSLRMFGAMPIAPLRAHFEHLLYPQQYELWMQEDFEYVRMSQAVLRLAGISQGADREVTLAQEIGIPVFTDYTKLKNWAEEKFNSGEYTPVYSCMKGGE